MGQLFWILKWGKRYWKVGQVLPSGTKWGNSYQVVHYRNQIKETGKLDFCNLLLHLPLICLATGSLPIWILRSLNSVIIKKKTKKKSCPTTDVSAWFINLNLRNSYSELFHVFKAISLNSCKISRKLSITESDYSNFAGATLLKSLSTVDILLPILQNLKRNFLFWHLRKAAEVTYTCFSVMTLHSSSHERWPIKITSIKNFTIFTRKHLCWIQFLIKLHDCRPTTLLKSDSNTDFLERILQDF